MSTHDADKIGASPSDRRTMTRDPNATSGPVVESGEERDGLKVTHAGSTHLTTNIEGKWYVCNTRGEPFDGDGFGPFETESEAVAVAQEHNGQPDRKHLDGDAGEGEADKPAKKSEKKK